MPKTAASSRSPQPASFLSLYLSIANSNFAALQKLERVFLSGRSLILSYLDPSPVKSSRRQGKFFFKKTPEIHCKEISRQTM